MKKYFIIFCVLFFLISLNFFLASEYRDSLPSRFWVTDDVFQMNVADSFRNDKNFNLNYVITTEFALSEDEFNDSTLVKIGSPQGSKGPIYYILLGTVYDLFSTSQDDLFIHASFFNNFLMSIFIILFFFHHICKTFPAGLMIQWVGAHDKDGMLSGAKHYLCRDFRLEQ